MSAAAPTRGRRVLLVEDDDDTRRMLCSVLGDEGYDVHSARNGREALDALAILACPDVIVTDLMMPIMSGWELLVELRARNDTASIPIVVISAFYDPARELGRVWFVPKPLRIDALLATVAKSCAGAPNPPSMRGVARFRYRAGGPAREKVSDAGRWVETGRADSDISRDMGASGSVAQLATASGPEGSALHAEVSRKSPHGVTIWRLDGDEPSSLRLIESNAAAARLLAIDLDPLRGRTFREAFPNVPEERLRAYADVARSGRSTQLGEIGYGDANVPHSIFAVHAIPVADRCVALVFENVTERRHAQEQLIKVSAFLDSVVENIPHMIFVKDAQELRFERINRAGEELLGLTREALLGKSDYDFFPAQQAEFFQAADRETLRKGAVVDIEEEPILTATGTRWLHTKKIPIRASGTHAGYLLGISEDITVRREAQRELHQARDDLERRVEERTADLLKANEALRQSEEQLRHAQKMEAVGRLAGGVAHDFNNVLSVILSYADLAESALSPRDPLRDDMHQIREAAERAASLTKQLLAFSRQQVLQPRPLDLNNVVANLDKMMQRLIGEDIELTRRAAPKLGKVNADPGQIEQVIMNLAVNARDAMPNGGKLTIETANVDLDEAYANDHLGTTAGPHVMLAVSDTGSGMTAEIKSRIFEPFFTTKDQGKGTGLGLATVFGIVKQSGGNIWVYSEVGKGTTFKIYLPRLVDVGRDDGESAQGPVVEALGGGETILLVEDEDLVRRAARSSLRRLGYTILEASSADEALLLCERYSGCIHLMITDVVMPNTSGRELAERMAILRPEMRVLFMSGYTDDTIVHHGVLDKGVDFLQKPFNPGSLARKVRETLEKRQSRLP